MPFNDFDVFWRAANALVQGRDPYALSGVYHPLWSFFMFVPLASLPLELARWVWTLIEGLIFVAVLRRRAMACLLFMPVVLTFLMGQMVMPMLGLFALLRSGKFGGLALGLMMLKPQLMVLLLPWQAWQWWKTDRRQIVWLLTVLVVVMTAALAIQPDWIGRWLAVSGERLRAPISPTVWGLFSFLPGVWWTITAGLVSIILFVWAWRRNDIDLVMAATMLINPVMISYDQTLLTLMIRDGRAWIFLTLISWIAFGLSALELNERAAILTTLAVGVILLQRMRNQMVTRPA